MSFRLRPHKIVVPIIMVVFLPYVSNLFYNFDITHDIWACFQGDFLRSGISASLVPNSLSDISSFSLNISRDLFVSGDNPFIVLGKTDIHVHPICHGHKLFFVLGPKLFMYDILECTFSECFICGYDHVQMLNSCIYGYDLFLYNDSLYVLSASKVMDNATCIFRYHFVSRLSLNGSLIWSRLIFEEIIFDRFNQSFRSDIIFRIVPLEGYVVAIPHGWLPAAESFIDFRIFSLNMATGELHTRKIRITVSNAFHEKSLQVYTSLPVVYMDKIWFIVSVNDYPPFQKLIYIDDPKRLTYRIVCSHGTSCPMYVFVNDGILYVSYIDALYKVNISNVSDMSFKRINVTNPPIGYLRYALVLHDGIMYSIFLGSYVVAHYLDGGIKWYTRITPSGSVNSFVLRDVSLTLYGNGILVSVRTFCFTGVFCLDRETGEILWVFPCDFVYHALSVDGKVFIVTVDKLIILS